MAAFNDIRPAAARHLLVVPLQHVPNTNSLRAGRAEDVALVEEMLRVGKELLAQEGEELLPAGRAHDEVSLPPMTQRR